MSSVIINLTIHELIMGSVNVRLGTCASSAPTSELELENLYYFGARKATLELHGLVR